MDRDLLVGVVGGAVVVGALAAVLLAEARNADVGDGVRFDVTWTVSPENGPRVAGETVEGDQSAVELVVERRAVANVDVVLVWQDDVGAGDRFRVTVLAPDGAERAGEAANGQGGAGELHVRFEGLDPAPAASAVVARDEAEARARLVDGSGLAGAVGTWRLAVELLEAGDDAPVAGLPPVAEDTGQAWEVRTVLEAHTPTLARTEATR